MKVLKPGIALLIIGAMTVGCGGQGGGCRFFPFTQAPKGIAPELNLPLLDEPGTKVSLSSYYRDNPVLLIFWATWCPPCVEEIPVLNEWHEKYRDRELKIVSVNIQELRDDVLRFREVHPISYPVLLDSEGESLEPYGLVGLPIAVFLAKGGEIIYYGFGLPQNIDDLIQGIR